MFSVRKQSIHILAFLPPITPIENSILVQGNNCIVNI